jgi:hypothetical protein
MIILWRERQFFGKDDHSLERKTILWERWSFSGEKGDSLEKMIILWRERQFFGKDDHSLEEAVLIFLCVSAGSRRIEDQWHWTKN